MQRIVPIVFKIILFSMLFMAVLDTTLMLAEIISIHSRVSAFATTVQMEVASNNCLPSEMADAFDKYLNETLSGYKVLGNHDVSECVSHNMQGTQKYNFTINGKSENVYGLGEANAKDYGEFTKLVIQVKLYPSQVYFGYRTRDNKGMAAWRGAEREIVLTYAYDVPCLRYLK